MKKIDTMKDIADVVRYSSTLNNGSVAVEMKEDRFILSRGDRALEVMLDLSWKTRTPSFFMESGTGIGKATLETFFENINNNTTIDTTTKQTPMFRF